jgi:hypothetical protein
MGYGREAVDVSELLDSAGRAKAMATADMAVIDARLEYGIQETPAVMCPNDPPFVVDLAHTWVGR